MSFTLYSLIMSVLCSDIFIIVLYILRKKKLLIRYDGIFAVLFLYILTLLRLFVPAEFSFTKPIGMPTVLNPVKETVERKIPVVGLTIGDVLIACWIVIAAMLIIKHIVLFVRINRKVVFLSDKADSKYDECLRKINREYGKRTEISLRVSNITNIPMGFGIFKKIILLPKQEYSDDQLYYILLHECSHFYNHDVLVKLLTKLFCCLFWWNPVIYLLDMELENTLEIKCDLKATAGLNKKEKIGYLETILESLKKTVGGSKTIYQYSTALFHSDSMELLPERMNAVVKNGTNKANVVKYILLLAPFICIYFISYMIVFQPAYMLSEQQQKEMGIITSSEDNVYILLDEHGKYYYVLGDVNIRAQISKEDAEKYVKTGINFKEEL